MHSSFAAAFALKLDQLRDFRREQLPGNSMNPCDGHPAEGKICDDL